MVTNAGRTDRGNCLSMPAARLCQKRPFLRLVRLTGPTAPDACPNPVQESTSQNRPAASGFGFSLAGMYSPYRGQIVGYRPCDSYPNVPDRGKGSPEQAVSNQPTEEAPGL